MKSKKVGVSCESCKHCIYICEGDFICTLDSEPELVIEDWEPIKFPVECGKYKE